MLHISIPNLTVHPNARSCKIRQVCPIRDNIPSPNLVLTVTLAFVIADSEEGCALRFPLLLIIMQVGELTKAKWWIYCLVTMCPILALAVKVVHLPRHVIIERGVSWFLLKVKKMSAFVPDL